MYSLSQIRRTFDVPKLVLREVNRWYYTRFRRWEYNKRGDNFFDEDWDNLLILDACRYDAFAAAMDRFDLPGELEARNSRGACTRGFLRGNIHGADLEDVVYVAATTMMYRESVFRDELSVNFHEIVDVWEDSIDAGEWGVRPATMGAAAKRAVSDYPNKRIVVHFIQPHIPFLGPTGEKYADRIENSVWADCFARRTDVSDDVLWQAYRENLDLVLEEVEDLLEELPGKTVVTSDHGQFIGDRAWPIPIKEYGHPNGIFAEALVKVPWLTATNGRRREVTAERGQGSYERRGTDELDEKARQHLEKLGYLS